MNADEITKKAHAHAGMCLFKDPIATGDSFRADFYKYLRYMLPDPENVLSET